MVRPSIAILSALVVLAQVPAGAGQIRGRSAPPPPSPAPPLFEVFEQSILDLQAAQTAGRVASKGLVESYLARIAAYDQAGPALNAIVLLNPRARDEAEALDRERAAKGPRGPLHGIPVLIKDNYDTADMPTTAGTLGLATLRPAADAFQVKRLRDAGAVILGKTTMHELAAGITTISSLTGQTRNPYDLARVPGGSSGGTGAAIGASLAAAGMGSDTCGSIRIPAANQNLVGLRATRGLSSRTGVIPLSSTQDVAGPLARTVTDLAIMLDATVGADPQDAVTADAARAHPEVVSGFAQGRRAQGGSHWRAPLALWIGARRRGGRRDCPKSAGRDEGARGGGHRRLGTGPGRSLAGQQRDQRRVQVRSRRLSRARPECAGQVAWRDHRSGLTARGARSDVSAAERAGKARDGTLSPGAGEAASPARSGVGHARGAADRSAGVPDHATKADARSARRNLAAAVN